MVDLNAIAAFVAVANEGTFSGGAKTIGIPKGSISRKISGLEKALGARLFNRTTRKVTLTQIGQSYYQRCRHAMDELAAANQLVDETIATPKGVLRISAPAAFGGGVFAKWVATYMQSYPDTKVELLLSDTYLDLVEKRIDIAFRFGQLRDSSLIARKFASIHRVVCASPKYLETHGEPKDCTQLANHIAIIHSDSLGNDNWRLVGPDGKEVLAHVKPRLAGESMNLIINAALAGLGIALLPQEAIQIDLDQGALKRILPAFTAPEQGFYALYPSNRQLSINVKAFLELVDMREYVGS